MDAKYLKSAATCTEKAVYYKSCAVCGLSSEGTADEATFFSGNALDHNWGAWMQNSDEKTPPESVSVTPAIRKPRDCHGGTATCTAKSRLHDLGRRIPWRMAEHFSASQLKKQRAQYLRVCCNLYRKKAIYYKSCAVCGLSSEGTADEATFFSGMCWTTTLGGAWTQNKAIAIPPHPNL